MESPRQILAPRPDSQAVVLRDPGARCAACPGEPGCADPTRDSCGAKRRVGNPDGFRAGERISLAVAPQAAGRAAAWMLGAPLAGAVFCLLAGILAAPKIGAPGEALAAAGFFLGALGGGLAGAYAARDIPMVATAPRAAAAAGLG